MPTAAAFGHVALHRRRARLARFRSANSSATRPASSSVRRSRLGTSTSSMATHLLTQPVGDLCGEAGDLGRVDPTGPFYVDLELVDDSSGPRRQQYDPVRQAGRLAHVVGD